MVTAVQTQLDYAEFAVAALEGLSCQVESVLIEAHRERPQIRISNATPLLAWLDQHRSVHVLEQLTPNWERGGARFRECDVCWLTRKPDTVQTPAGDHP